MMRRYRWIAWIIAVFICELCACHHVEAAKKYTVVENEYGLNVYYGNKLIKNTRLAIKEKKDSYTVVKPNVKNSEIYEFDKDGDGTLSDETGFVKITYNGKRNVYYLKDGELRTNQIVGNKKTGYYYVDENGIRVKDKTTRLAVKFVKDHTDTKDSQSEKLKKCYYYLAEKYSYTRYYTNLYPKAKDMKT